MKKVFLKGLRGNVEENTGSDCVENRIRTGLVVAIFVIFLCGKQSLAATPKVAQSTTTVSGRLKVNGYKKAKWGMSPAQVEKALGRKAFRKERKKIWFKMGGKKRLECLFFRNKFYMATYFIEHESSAAEVEKILREKYGRPSKVNESSPIPGVTMRFVRWNDGLAEIFFLASKNRAAHVSYSNIKTAKRANAAEKQKKKQRQKKRRKKLKDDL